MCDETRDFKSIANDLDKVLSMSCKPSFNKVKDGYIFDEDKSVKWNREQVIINNDKYNEEVKRLNTEKNKKRDALYEEMYSAIIEYIDNKKMNRKKAEKLWYYAWEEGHSGGMHEVLNNLETIMDIVIDMFQ